METARPVPIPPDAPTAPALPEHSGPWRAHRYLHRLARAMRRYGWTTEVRYGQLLPTLLRVYSAAVPSIGESVTVVRANGIWWYRASTGEWLAPCTNLQLATQRLSVLLTPWVTAALASSRDETK
ncbi:hypothetical protein GCM10023085_35930 [Actinomadura viridis]|uniref:Uncharacterized protein n=1 Tax=Actinomadura viridis TaxID=58110 RepID=A0A931DJ22_9ACTN|nr:hypothetical protein [Actinomadura viridis]MBG6087870.1 hypothetical protein [Actinomadura viridis]